MAAALPDLIDDLARPLAEAAGLELVDVEVKGSGGRIRIRVTVDRDGGVDVGSCQKLSKALARALDQDDPIAGRYTLEVSSPGTDRPLTDQRSFGRALGRTVAVTIPADAQPDGEPDPPAPTVVLTGDVAEVREDVVVIVDGDVTHEVGYERILKATQVLPW